MMGKSSGIFIWMRAWTASVASSKRRDLPSSVLSLRRPLISRSVRTRGLGAFFVGRARGGWAGGRGWSGVGVGPGGFAGLDGGELVVEDGFLGFGEDGGLDGAGVPPPEEGDADEGEEEEDADDDGGGFPGVAALFGGGDVGGFGVGFFFGHGFSGGSFGEYKAGAGKNLSRMRVEFSADFGVTVFF